MNDQVAVSRVKKETPVFDKSIYSKNIDRFRFHNHLQDYNM